MIMPKRIDESMFAPCGINCIACYKHLTNTKRKKPCQGCLKDDTNKPLHCRKCNIKACVKEKGLVYCYTCEDFPCKLIKRLEKSYTTRYQVSLIDNSKKVKETGLTAFMKIDRVRWTCPDCQGIISQHDQVCSKCKADFTL